MPFLGIGRGLKTTVGSSSLGDNELLEAELELSSSLRKHLRYASKLRFEIVLHRLSLKGQCNGISLRTDVLLALLDSAEDSTAS